MSSPPGRAPGRLQERVRYLLARAFGHLPPGVLVRLSGEPPVVVDGHTLDPHAQLLRALRRRERVPGLVEPDHRTGRARFRREMLALAGPRTPVRAVRDLEIPGPAGPLRVRHYAPDDATGALLVFFHGGGFVIGDLDTHDEGCRLLCRHAATHVLAVDYRLAPEHPFPAALDDATAALRWARAHAASLGAQAPQVAVGGDSAGGNLATVVARIAARDGWAPAAQLLIYPPTDSETPCRSHHLFGDGFFLSTRDREAFARCYVKGTGIPGSDPRISPLRAPDLHGLPPALVVTAAFDALRDEGEAYADALRAAGTVVRHYRVPTLGHGFVNMTGISRTARREMIEIARQWRALLQAAAGGDGGMAAGPAGERRAGGAPG